LTFFLSSDDDDDEEVYDDVDSLDFRLGRLEEREELEEERTDWFSVVGNLEHASTSRFIFYSLIEVLRF
jgi:hypothetical protein